MMVTGWAVRIVAHVSVSARDPPLNGCYIIQKPLFLRPATEKKGRGSERVIDGEKVESAVLAVTAPRGTFT